MNIIQITCENFSAEINADCGANCISLKNKKYNANILREVDYSKEYNAYLHGMPILFPVNRIAGGTFVFENRRYQFPINDPETLCCIHGTLSQQPFEVDKITENSIVCTYSADENEYFSFPHKFSVQIAYTLTRDGLIHQTQIFNKSACNMPVFLGFHTTFNIDFAGNGKQQNTTVGVELCDEIERDMSNFLPTGRIVKLDDISKRLLNGTFNPMGQKISRHYKAGINNLMTLTDYKKGLQIVYENDAKFRYRLIYNGDADEFICLEPQTCMVNCMNLPFDKEYSGFDYIAPKNSKTYTSKITLKEI